MISDLFPYLDDIVFANKAPEDIEADIFKIYEQISGRTLAKGDPVRLFIETIALVIVQQRALIDYAAKMNLLAYSSGSYLDHLGALLGVTRLEASNALTTLKFTLSEAQNTNILIPAGIRATPDGKILFATVEAATILAGETSINITAECTTSGEIGNGFLPGQIKRLVDPFGYEASVENIDASYGGSDIENDENFRERIQIAPESFSVAGARGAYEYFARSSHQDIIDVAVIGPPELEPGCVEIYPLMKNGEIPTNEILELVYDTCNADDVRPLTDCVSVHAPKVINFDLDVKYFIDRSRATQSAELQTSIEKAVNDWITWQRSKLGRDLNPSELNHRMIAAGAKRT
ncbi:MAG: baseplate J/gp47 family protein [Synergistaceae bacterium]|nr:baseplate J/gp47 family protein [Synergistaceae bacterium]